MARSGVRSASAGVAVCAALALAFGTAAAVRGGPSAPPAAAKPESSPSPGATGPVFGGSTSAKVGPHPIDIVSADFNHDGSADLVVAHERNDHDDDSKAAEDTDLTLLLADGRGGFRTSRLDSSARSLAVADLDGDGAVDLVASDHYRENVAVFLGDGQGGFATPVRHPTIGSSPSKVLTSDLDADGDLDLAVLNRGSEDVAVLLGDGRGGFAYPTRFRTDLSEPTLLLALDLRGGGTPDLVVGGSEGVVAMRNRGSGAFATPTPLAVKLPWSAEARTADVDGDGVLDVILAGDGAVVVLHPDGRGGLRAGERVRTGFPDGHYDVAAGDIDGDGRIDLAVVDGWRRAWTILGSPGGFTAPVRQRLKVGGNRVVLADVDGDCALDLVVTERNRRLRSYLNARQISCPTPTSAPVRSAGRLPRALDGAGAKGGPPRGPRGGPAFAAPRTTLVGGDVTDLVSGDFNGDGDPDVAGTEVRENRIVVLLGNGRGGFGTPWRVSMASEPRTRPRTGGRGLSAGQRANSRVALEEGPVDLTVGDVDADGDLDLVAAMADAGDIAVLRGDGRGRFAAAVRYPVAEKATPWRVELADLDGDGDLDAVTQDGGAAEADNGASILLGDGAGRFTPARRLHATDGFLAGALVAADIDGDDDVDVLVYNPNRKHTVGSRVAVFRNDGYARFDPPTHVLGGAVGGLSVADVDLDGRPDLVGADHSRRVSVLYGDGRGGFGRALHLDTGGSGPGSVAIADLTGDGRPDLVVSNGPSREHVVLAGRGRGGFGAPVRFPAGAGGGAAVILIDVDRDGALDLVSTAAGDITVRTNTNLRARAAGVRAAIPRL